MLKGQKNSYTPYKFTAALILENGKIFWGEGLGAKVLKIGELCFNTAQSGYRG